MTPEERDLRRVLEARSGEPSPQFRARLTAALDEYKPSVRLMPAIAMVTVVAISLGTVGVLLMSRAGVGGLGSGTRYTVTSTLMADGRGPFRACTSYPLSSPPPGCYGVDVANVDVAAIPGVVVVSSNGIVRTPSLKLVGTWDSRLHLLRLTEPPIVVDRYASTPPKLVAQAPPAPSGKTPEQVLNEIRRDDAALQQRGIVFLMSGEGVDGVEVTLAVADVKSVQYLYDTYGRMKIKGWLQPAGPEKATTRPTPSARATLPPMATQLIAPIGNVIWAFAGGFLFRSTDRGNTWEQRPLPPIQQIGGAPEFSFLDAQQGWYLTGGSFDTCNVNTQIWHTPDGGSTWGRVPIDMSTLPQTPNDGMTFPDCSQGFSFIDPTHGFLATWATGRHAKIYRTADGGKTWSGTQLPDPPDFTTGKGLSLQAGPVKRFGSTLYVLAWVKRGEYMTDRQYIFGSTDGGATWSWLMKIPSRYIAMVTESRWVQLAVPGQSMESTNSGQQWHPYASDFNIDTLLGGPQIVFGDPLVGYAEIRGSLKRTVDGGLHWTRIAMPGTFPVTSPAATAACTIDNGAATPRALWSKYSSSKWGYSVDYPADWCNIPNLGVPDSNRYFSNENAGSPTSMSPAGIWMTLSVASGPCPASPRGFREVYDQTVLKVAGQDVTRTYGWVPGASETTQMIHAALAHGSSCYTFDFVTRDRFTGNNYLAIADQMITSLRFT